MQVKCSQWGAFARGAFTRRTFAMGTFAMGTFARETFTRGDLQGHRTLNKILYLSPPRARVQHAPKDGKGDGAGQAEQGGRRAAEECVNQSSSCPEMPREHAD